MAKNNLKDNKEEIERLVVLVQEGEHDAFSKIYDFFVDPLFRYIYYRVKAVDAEDLLEVVFLKVWENIKKYKAGKSSFSAWIFRITHNVVVDYYRTTSGKETSELTLNISDTKREHNPIKTTELVLDNEILKEALSKLKKRYRDIIIYKFINELSNKEICELLKKSEGSVRILQFRALKALRKVMEDMGVKYEFYS
ncbi:sigma-70 family RNA polymerase sigma factor [Patescibacteria group bacterium]